MRIQGNRGGIENRGVQHRAGAEGDLVEGKMNKYHVLAIGIALGVGIGAATHNISLWLPIGVAVGLTLGFVKKTDKE